MNCMKRQFLVFSCYLLFFVIGSNAQNGTVFTNDICLPSKQYLLSGVENNFYIQSFIKRWRPYDDFVRFSGTVKYERRYETVATIKNSKTEQIIKVELVNGDSFNIVKKLECIVITGEPGTGNGEVTVQFLGDSFTKGNYFKSAFIDKGYVPNVKCVGLRKVTGVEGQYHEGRGGWTLENYFSQNVTSATFFNPFYQPQGKFRFWGSTAFWMTAVKVNNKTITSTGSEPGYSCSDYDTSRFDEFGRLAKPRQYDVMFDSNLKEYIVWNGKRWENTSCNTFRWSFQYDKYLTMWNVRSPEFLVVMLGLNDFRDKSFPLDFTLWNSRIDTLLNSYRDVVPNGKLVLCTPCTSCGRLNNSKGDFTVRQNAAMWEHRKNIIDNFDNREKDGLYVVDASITIDNDFGYKELKPELPYKGYTGDNRLIVQEGNPHPYLSYPNLGVPVAAFIQYFRNK